MKAAVLNDGEKWNAVCENNIKADGVFFYGIKTTGIFCKPSCRSKMPLKKNVIYFDSMKEAQSAGFRPCKRCPPDLFDFQPAKELAEKAKGLIDRHFDEIRELLRGFEYMGVTRHRMVEIFKEQYGMTMAEYTVSLKLQAAKEQLLNSDDTVLNVASGVGFESISSFYKHFVRETGMPPAAFRKKYRKEHL